MGGLDRTQRVLAEPLFHRAADPARQALRGFHGEPFGPLDGDLAQHGVDHARQPPRGPAGLGQFHGAVDDAMGIFAGHQQLCGGQPQDEQRAKGRFTVEIGDQNGVYGLQMAQDQPGQTRRAGLVGGAMARIGRQMRQHPLVAQHPFQRLDGGKACIQSRALCHVASPCSRGLGAYITCNASTRISAMDDATDRDLSQLPPEAQRALAEAEDRRKKAKAQDLPTELGGRDGPEPVRYGDWERKGIAVDF